MPPTSPDTPRLLAYKPFVVKATYDWILSNNHSATILFLSDYPGMNGTEGLSNDTTFSIEFKPESPGSLVIDTAKSIFTALVDINGKMATITGPVESVLAVMDSELGEGPHFNVTLPSPEEAEKYLAIQAAKNKKKTPHLALVKK